MKTLQRVGGLGTLGFALMLGACNGDKLTNGTSDDPTLDADVARVSADATSEDIEMMGGPTGAYGFGFAAPSFNVALRWGCENKTRDGLSVTRTCVFKDANGAVQDQYDPATTATVEIEVHVSGSVTRPNWEATVDRERHLVVTGLTGQETSRTWNGTGNGTVTRSKHTDHGGELRTYDITYTTTIENVVVPVPRSESRWPTSGTITRHATIKITGGPRDGQTVDRTVTVTFNGTNKVTVTVDASSFSMDLNTRQIDG